MPIILCTNSADPDQMPHIVASDQGLHCLPMSIYWTLGINRLQVDKRKKELCLKKKEINFSDCSQSRLQAVTYSEGLYTSVKVGGCLLHFFFK